MYQRLEFTGKQQLSYADIVPQDSLAGNQVRARAVCSLMSTGTENIVYNRLFDPGTHWDSWVQYPFHPGYSWVGEVVEIGSDVTGISLGQRIVVRKAHAEEHIVDFNECVVVPDDMDVEKAVWFALAKICYSGAMAANYQLGSTVLIIGGGPIGQMSTRWARCAGAGKIVMVEPLELRQRFALQGGAHVVIGKHLDQAEEDILAAFDGKRPEIVIDSTGVAAVFQGALKICADRGRVVILGDTGAPAAQHLSQDVITRRIHIIGAHDAHFELEFPVKLFCSLLSDGRFNVDNLNTHHFEFKDAKKAYELANTHRGETMGIVFRY